MFLLLARSWETAAVDSGVDMISCELLVISY